MWVLGTIAFIAICVIKIGPLYLNEMNVARCVERVASDPGMANAEPAVVREALAKQWAVDYIDENQISYKDVRVKRTAEGRSLTYDYEARVDMFYDIGVYIHFVREYPMRNSRT
ncbi:MAG TPA: DUF4845 domain-containing protein [Nevskiaceae bacterium]|nr:DUF4845 domain-containing protein [Nevskiaceae bacterium]